MFKHVCAAVAAASLSVAASSALAQDASTATAGGDVTADEATPLPPIVVQSPNEPIASRRRSKGAGASSTPSTAAASDGSEGSGTTAVQGEGPAIGVFTLGQLDMIGGSTITNEAMYTFNKSSLGQAVNILPGVTWQSTGAPSVNSSGARNEGDIFVRGFNRFQVPLYMDGVRVYLPADNRIDMNRFLTADLAEVQIAKGYVSVLNGPGGMGGAINMVSRKPTKELEMEARVGSVFDGDLGSMGQWSSYGYTGTRQKGYYAQISGSIVDQDHFDMSSDFSPSSYSVPGPGHVATFPYEQGGNRDRSDFKDWRINAKVGITPNATDEYSINYTTQSGEKNSPLHTDRQIVQGYFNAGYPNGSNGNYPRFWTWPEWDTSSLSFLSKTQLGSASYIKTNAYYNTFANTISFFPDATYTNQRVESPYEDDSYGGFIEMGTDLIPMNTLKGAIHYRKDAHEDQNVRYAYPSGNQTIAGYGNLSRQAEEGWSFALENTFHATRNLDFVAGVSYETNEVLENKVNGIEAASDRPSIDAWNWQAAAIYHYSQTGSVHADVSSRMRFPTLFERYSTRFDSKIPDPNLPPERATNYEIGASDTLFPGLRVSSAVFYSDIEDSIQNAFVAANGTNGNNAGIIGVSPDGYYYGAELSADYDVSPTLRVGGNYTFTERDLDFADASTEIAAAWQREAVGLNRMEGLPKHKAFFYVAWKATNQLTLTPSLELASDRVALVTNCSSTLVSNGNANNASAGACGKTAPTAQNTYPSYVNIGSYALLNFRADYAFTENFSAAVGVTNLLDQNYSLAQGFPEPGRQFYATARVKF